LLYGALEHLLSIFEGFLGGVTLLLEEFEFAIPECFVSIIGIG